MISKPPAQIEDMKTLYYADVRPFSNHLKKYMAKVPDLFVVIFYPPDNSYCILGTDAAFSNWEGYTNYVFKEVEPALQFPDTIFRVPDEFCWVKV